MKNQQHALPPVLIYFEGEQLFNLNSVSTLTALESGKHCGVLLEFKTWVLSFLSKPHSDLGCAGRPVCPYVELSIEFNQFWANSQLDVNFTFEKMKDIVQKFKQIFLNIASLDQSKKIFTTIVVLFPNLRSECYSVIDDIQQHLKPEFVEKGLMIGQFYPGCSHPGLHNALFRPLDSPVPLIAIRNMVKSDWPFLEGNPHFEKLYHQLYEINRQF